MFNAETNIKHCLMLLLTSLHKIISHKKLIMVNKSGHAYGDIMAYVRKTTVQEEEQVSAG